MAATVLLALPGRTVDLDRAAELLALARHASRPHGARVHVVTGDAGAAATLGADVVHTVDGAALDVPDVRTWASAFLGVYAAVRPGLVLLDDGAFDRAVAAWMAQRSGGALVTGCVDLWWDGTVATVTRGILGGAGVQTCRPAAGALPVLCMVRGATLQGAAVDAAQNGTAHARPESVTHVTAAAPSATVVAERSAPQRLRGARIVVAGGAGVGGEAGMGKVRRLAELLGGASGAARGAIVNGWAGAVEKVGLTGVTVTPELYLAVGISGASQHMAGCRRARVIVAVNRDKSAPIFRHATYGLVADSTAVLDALLAAVEGDTVTVQDRIAEDAPT